MKLGRVAEGMQTFKDAVAKFPDNTQLHDAYTDALMTEKQTHEAGLSIPRQSPFKQMQPVAGRGRGGTAISAAKKAAGIDPITSTGPLNADNTPVVEVFCSWLATQPAGEVRSTDMGKFYSLYPKLKGSIGKLSAFCRDNSKRLKLEERQKTLFVMLLL
jgi:hypothetical protein